MVWPSSLGAATCAFSVLHRTRRLEARLTVSRREYECLRVCLGTSESLVTISILFASCISRWTLPYAEKMPRRISFFPLTLFLLSLGPALAIIPPSRNPTLVVESGLLVVNGSALDYDLPLTNINAGPQCDGAQYGRNLPLASCEEVLDLFNPIRDDPVLEFGQRGHYDGTAKLPMRWLSCKSHIFHLNHRKPFVSY